MNPKRGRYQVPAPFFFKRMMHLLAVASDVTPQDVLTFICVMVAAVACVFLYWVPSMIASQRHHKDIGAISVVNLFFGWTFLGWVVALAWACSGNVKEVGK